MYILENEIFDEFQVCVLLPSLQIVQTIGPGSSRLEAFKLVFSKAIKCRINNTQKIEMPFHTKYFDSTLKIG